MKHSEFIQYALICLESLEQADPQSAEDISRSQRVPLKTCREVLRRLEATGIVEILGDTYCLTRPLCEWTALDIVEALKPPREQAAAFKLMFGPRRGVMLRPTLEAAGRFGRWLPIAEG
jgi:DNA-binding IscR family transcriptional regulator